MNAIKILIWGMGYEYSRYINQLKMEEQLESIQIVGVTSNDEYAMQIDDITCISKKDIFSEQIVFNCILVMAGESLQREIYQEITVGLSSCKWKYTVINCRVMDIPGFTFEKYIRLADSQPSIMAENCWGGLTYHYLHLAFQSPLINLNLSNKDYFKLMKNPDLYMEEELIEIGKGFNAQEEYDFPICKLGDIHVNFVHYRKFESALEKWNDRKKRMNWNNIVAMTYTYDLHEAELFQMLPYEKKICFVPFETDMDCCMKVNLEAFSGLNKEDPLPDVFFGGATGRYALYDIWELLLNGQIVNRAIFL